MKKDPFPVRKNTIPVKASRDPAQWKVLSVSEGDDPYVEFEAGVYVSKSGIRIPVVFKCYKSGIIYKMWLAEMAKRNASARLGDPGLIEVQTEIIDERDNVGRHDTLRIEGGRNAQEGIPRLGTKKEDESSEGGQGDS